MSFPSAFAEAFNAYSQSMGYGVSTNRDQVYSFWQQNPNISLFSPLVMECDKLFTSGRHLLKPVGRMVTQPESEFITSCVGMPPQYYGWLVAIDRYESVKAALMSRNIEVRENPEPMSVHGAIFSGEQYEEIYLQNVCFIAYSFVLGPGPQQKVIVGKIPRGFTEITRLEQMDGQHIGGQYRSVLDTRVLKMIRTRPENNEKISQLQNQGLI